MRRSLCLLLVASGACGRLNFDGVANGDASSPDDGGGSGSDVGDALPGDMVEVPVVPQPFDFSPGTPWKQVTLTRSFALDRTEVTVGRWKAWVDAGRPVPSDGAVLDVPGHYPGMVWHNVWDGNAKDTSGYVGGCGSPWTINGSTYQTGDPTLPMNCVTWPQAVAFCAWDGAKRLPTTVEWNYEARGGTGGTGDHRPYAWGSTPPDCAHAIYSAGADMFCGFPVAAGTASAGASAHGALDMSGSLWEFGWDSTMQPGLGAVSGEVPANSVDFTGLDLGTALTVTHVIYGGEWGEPENNLNLVTGVDHGPGEGWGGDGIITTVGLRCAKTLP